MHCGSRAASLECDAGNSACIQKQLFTSLRASAVSVAAAAHSKLVAGEAMQREVEMFGQMRLSWVALLYMFGVQTDWYCSALLTRATCRCCNRGYS